ncbi:MAG TPA: 16S rRNA (guanine(966)-N(2))-methyltransferase RsmD [Clostridiales bacterium]|nr:16S rRNA (guanine(966)-N(2))-methyltransferase RsmD [Clostridiales bacterium]
MRVIAGKAKRLQLKTPKGLDTRPTSDRIKETLFNMINPYLNNTMFLDLFSGSGAIGIEALSRGAKFATFVDKDRNSINCIKENLITTKLMDTAEIINLDVVKAINLLESKEVIYDLVFMDPPYNMDIEKEILVILENSNIINNDSIIIIESSIETKFDYIDNMNFQIFKTKEYGSCKHTFIEFK